MTRKRNRQDFDDSPSKAVAEDGGGRGPRGRFAPGNRIGKGALEIPKQVTRFRLALFAAVSPEDFQAVAKRLLKDAKSGKPWAVRLLFQYCLGEAVALDLLAELDELRDAVQQMQDSSQ
jgi:hypothetical protein